ncbi:hypothetical protein Peur_023152 [Populus x canadensis]
MGWPKLSWLVLLCWVLSSLCFRALCDDAELDSGSQSDCGASKVSYQGLQNGNHIHLRSASRGPKELAVLPITGLLIPISTVTTRNKQTAKEFKIS